MEKILVVDDSKMQLAYVGLLLTKQGYKIEKVHDPQKAKVLIEKNTYDLLLCDLKMPDIDGIEMLHLSKKHHPNMPVIIMTAFDDRLSAIKALSDGAEDYIFKANGELEEKEFLIRIRRVLDKANLQQKILDYQTHLEDMVEERTRELKDTQDQLVQSEKLRALGILTKGVAHDFNNILGVIVWRTQMMIRNIKEAETIKELKLIEKSALKGASTIRRMQDYSRLRTDQSFEPVQLNEVVKDVVEMTEARWEDEAHKKGIDYKVKVDLEDIPFISGNPSELKDVIINIIFNALDAMPEGGQLHISTAKMEIVNEEWVYLEIRDTGSGIPDKIKSKIFDPFFTTKQDQGAGLGMSLAYNVIQRHKGTITFESEEKKGTTFYLRFPSALFIQEAFPQVSEKKSKKKLKHKYSILIIDDDESIRSMLAQMLEASGHSIVSVSSGKEALEKIGKRYFDIVLTDLGMPGMSGWEVAEKVKEITSTTRVIMITGWGTQLDKDKAENLGIERIIPKPVSYEEIINVVEE